MTDEERPGEDSAPDADPAPEKSWTGKNAAGRRYNWEAIRTSFVEGVLTVEGELWWPNLREIAEMHDVPYTRTREHSASEGWTEQRAAFQAHLEKVRQKRRATELAKEAVELDGKALTLAKAGIQLVMTRMAEIGRAIQARQEEQEDGFGAMLPSVDAREIDTLARAAVQWHNLGAKALGEVETTRTEIVGADGGPLEIRSSIRAELVKDDPDRLHGFLLALERSGLASAVEGADPPGLTRGEDGDAEEGGAPDS